MSGYYGSSGKIHAARGCNASHAVLFRSDVLGRAGRAGLRRIRMSRGFVWRREWVGGADDLIGSQRSEAPGYIQRFDKLGRPLRAEH